MAVSKRLRFEILRRDGHRCRYCGAGVSDAILTVDHVTPVALGGTDMADNLVAACEDCNGGKTSTMPESPMVAAVADDAVRWALAIKQAALELEAQEAPKLAYRAAFKEAWDSWTYPSGNERKTFDLPADWRSSVERYRLAGLPESAWPDVIEPGMANKKVTADNIFRYMCGVANKRVEELHVHAKSLLGDAGSDSSEDERDSLIEAAVDIWVNETGGHISNEQGYAFTASVTAVREDDHAFLEPHRLIQGAQYAAWFEMTNVSEALDDLDRDELMRAWSFAWLAKVGEYPDKDLYGPVRDQCDKLLKAGVYRGRILPAAMYAGAHRSGRIYFGLSEDELAATGLSSYLAQASEIWAKAFLASADRWPAEDERLAFFDSIRRLGQDPDGFFVGDVHAAATAAGAYQDADLTTCLSRHLSVLEIAALPLRLADADA